MDVEKDMEGEDEGWADMELKALRRTKSCPQDMARRKLSVLQQFEGIREIVQKGQGDGN